MPPSDPAVRAPRSCSVQVVTPEQLNQMTETELVARAAAALTAADDASAARRPAAAPFVTLALALRVYNHVQSL
eukprot:134899-Prymnesium_polylepis.1